MPALDPSVVAEFAAAVRPDQLISELEQLRTYDCDGLMRHRVTPALVLVPERTSEVQAIVRVCNAHGIPFVARGAGTGLSGGALPVAEGVVISLARFTRVVEIDVERGEIVVEPGVANLDVTAAARRTASTTRPTRPRSRSARSAATWRRTRAGRTA
jgi:glycolate oxidase